MTREKPDSKRRISRGFRRAGTLAAPDIRQGGEGRGFSVARVLTQWTEIAGEEMASIARPVEISYGRGGLGACLTLLVSGAHAPMIEMQKERLRERVNACYGYNAVRRIRLTQTSSSGASPQAFAEEPTPYSAAAPNLDACGAEARNVVSDVSDDRLRSALAKLGAHVLAPRKSS
ncbi:MAG: DciA family protein [Pseudomonadota bacterium]